MTAVQVDDDGRMERLAGWIERTLAFRPSAADIVRASNGFSAETLFVTGPARDLVIRIERAGSHIFPDSDIVEQAHAMRLLATHGVPVPEIFAVEEDDAVVDGRFLVMAKTPGRTFPQVPSYAAAGWVRELGSSERALLWKNALALMASINRLGAKDGFSFLNRGRYGTVGLDQHLGWLRHWRDEALGNAPHPIIDLALDHLCAAAPSGVPASLTWGDCNPGNILFGPDLQVTAALDFEAIALGPAEVDLGWWLFLDSTRTAGHPPLPGCPDRADAVAIYERFLGRAVADIDYFEIMGGVRMALVIAQTVRRLVERGAMRDGTDAVIANPMVTALARLMGLDSALSGDGFDAFRTAVTNRN